MMASPAADTAAATQEIDFYQVDGAAEHAGSFFLILLVAFGSRSLVRWRQQLDDRDHRFVVSAANRQEGLPHLLGYREQALDRLAEDAESLGANAIMGLRFTTTSMMQGAAEFLVYGTAVLVEE